MAARSCPRGRHARHGVRAGLEVRPRARGLPHSHSRAPDLAVRDDQADAADRQLAAPRLPRRVLRGARVHGARDAVVHQSIRRAAEPAVRRVPHLSEGGREHAGRRIRLAVRGGDPRGHRAGVAVRATPPRECAARGAADALRRGARADPGVVRAVRARGALDARPSRREPEHRRDFDRSDGERPRAQLHLLTALCRGRGQRGARRRLSLRLDVRRRSAAPRTRRDADRAGGLHRRRDPDAASASRPPRRAPGPRIS